MTAPSLRKQKATNAGGTLLARHRGAPCRWPRETGGRLGKEALTHLQKLARKQAESLEEGGDAAVSALLTKWAAWLSAALHTANASAVRSALGGVEVTRRRAELLREELSR